MFLRALNALSVSAGVSKKCVYPLSVRAVHILSVVASLLALGLFAASSDAQFFPIEEEENAETPVPFGDAPRSPFLLRGPNDADAGTDFETETDPEPEEGRDGRLGGGLGQQPRGDGDGNTDDRQFLLRSGVEEEENEEDLDPQDDDGRDPSPDEPLEPRRNPTRKLVRGPVNQLPETGATVSRLPAPDLNGRDDGRQGPGAPIGVPPNQTLDETVAVTEERVVEEPDPYAPIGTRARGAVFLPSIELRSGYTDNAGGSSVDPEDSTFQEVTAALRVETDWSRHAFVADLTGSHTNFNDVQEENESTFDGEGRLTLDITSRTALELAGSYELDQISVGDEGAPPGSEDRPFVHTIDGSAELSRRFNRLTAAALVGTEAEDFEDGEVNGEIVDNSDLNFHEDRFEGSIAYELSPKTEIGVILRQEITEFEQTRDDEGRSRDSEAISALASLVLRPSAKLDFEGTAGIETRSFDRPDLGDVEELVFEGSLTWRPSVLTSITVSGDRDVEVTTESGSSAVASSDYALSLTHSFRANASVTLRGLLGVDKYFGSAREDERIEAEIEFLYALSRYVAFVADLGYEERESNFEGEDRSETQGSIGVRFQY